MAFLDNTGVARLVTDLKSKFATLVSGAVAVVQGGTGKTTHTTNAVLTGNGANAVNNVATADGALYATAANGAAQFGTLPVAQGGTAGTTEAEARENLEVPVNAAIATVESTTATANHAIGDHFMLDDKLKTATAAIATGETINATNSADDTVQAQIDTLRDSVDSMMPTTLTLTLHAGMFVTARGGGGGQIWFTTFVPIGYRTASVTSYPSTMSLLRIGEQAVTSYSITGVTQVSLGSNTVNIRLSTTGITEEMQCTLAVTTSITLSLTK